MKRSVIDDRLQNKPEIWNITIEKQIRSCVGISLNADQVHSVWSGSWPSSFLGQRKPSGSPKSRLWWIHPKEGVLFNSDDPPSDVVVATPGYLGPMTLLNLLFGRMGHQRLESTRSEHVDSSPVRGSAVT